MVIKTFFLRKNFFIKIRKVFCKVASKYQENRNLSDSINIYNSLLPLYVGSTLLVLLWCPRALGSEPNLGLISQFQDYQHKRKS